MQTNPVNRVANLPRFFMRLTGICDYPCQTNIGGWQVPSRSPPVRHCLKFQPNLSTWEQPLLPALDVIGMGWVIKRPSQGAAAEMLPKWRPTTQHHNFFIISFYHVLLTSLLATFCEQQFVSLVLWACDNKVGTCINRILWFSWCGPEFERQEITHLYWKLSITD